MKKWQIAEAKAKLTEVIHGCAEEPQILYNRNKAVAVMIRPEEYEAIEGQRRKATTPSMGELLDELAQINLVEDDLELPTRTNRAFPDWE